MRFTDGLWMVKPSYQITYAYEWFKTIRDDHGVTLIAATKPIARQGDILGSPTLQVHLDAPMEGIIGVELSHFLGSAARRLPFPVRPQPLPCDLLEGDGQDIVRSGPLQARISKGHGKWEIAFYAGERRLTRSGYRGAAHIADPVHKETYMQESLELNVGAMLYGLGERFGPFVKNGQSVEMWNADGGTGSEQAYKNIPFFLTNQGFGVLVDDPADVHFELGTERTQRAQFSVKGERLKYYLIYGETPKDILERYTLFTGRPALPPPWSFGLWLTTSFTTSYDETTVNRFLDGMDERKIPLSVFHFDCFWMRVLRWCDFEWDPDTFPQPEAMLKRYHDRGLKLCVWINPYIGQRSPLFEEGMRRGYLLRKTNGDVWQTDKWQPGMAIVDFTNPEATAWYTALLERLLDMGIDCFKTDFGERLPVQDIAYFDGSDPLRMHNYYAYLYNKAVFDLIERKRGPAEALVFARSATACCQQFPVHWGGDNSSSYPSMAETLRGGLSLALSGFGFWSHDISGFESTATPDLYKRWCAFGLLSSHSRLHGSSSYRVPWLFDEEACDVLRFFANLKCRLMPYLFAKAVEAHEHGIPMLRPMLLEFPNDPTCETLDRQYMLGDSLLVAPVFSEDGRVSFYLPRGRWISLLDEHVINGGGWHDAVCSYFELPLYVRENTMLIQGDIEDRPDYDYAAHAQIHLYGIQDGAMLRSAVHSAEGSIQVVWEATRRGNLIGVTANPPIDFTVFIHPGDGKPRRFEALAGSMRCSAAAE